MSYEYPAWGQMETVLDLYEQERQAYLDEEAKRLGPEAEQQWERFQQTADALVEGASELAESDGLVSLANMLREGQPGVERPMP